MAELTDDEIDAALERGKAARATEARATGVRYEKALNAIVVDLADGFGLVVPPRAIQGLAGATLAEIADVQVSGGGYGLHWPALDVDMSIPGLMAGITGTRAHMARQGGMVKSKAKATAARKNGAKGGRPKKRRAA